MTETKPKRRWFRFSLRTLFVLVTIVGVAAGWVAYQLNWIRERHKFVVQYGSVEFPGLKPNLNTGLPWSLKLFGELPEYEVLAPSSQVQRAQELFPEAAICSD